jgi:acyl-CoA synthetase (NDP forming)
VAQSGAFAISRADRWHRLVPKYVLTTGNQIDLTLGDCLTWLQDDRDIHVFALYVEGFKPNDGWRTLAAIEGIARSGRTVVAYRAGRTAAGVRASASHTASIAGDYLVTRALFEEAGACVADTIERFEDVVYLATVLDGRRPAGGRVATVSNAGFECVAMADWVEPLRLAALAPGTTTALRASLSARHIDAIVDVHNPLDLTPMADAATYEAAMRTVLGDPAIDLAVLGCIPFTPALDTLRPGPGHSEDLAGPDALPARLGRIRAEAFKPFVVVVDAGARYDAFAAAIEQHDIPVFRTADRAMRALATWLGGKAATS